MSVRARVKTNGGEVGDTGKIKDEIEVGAEVRKDGGGMMSKGGKFRPEWHDGGQSKLKV